MQFLDMPPTKLVGYAVTRSIIEETLHAAGFNWPARHLTWVRGAPRSIRIFAASPIPESSLLPRPMDLQGMIYELVSLAMSEAVRYGPRVNPKSRKGWEIRSGQIGDTPILVVLATWV